MTVALILAIIFALLLLILLLPLKLRIIICDGFHFTVRYGVIKVFDNDRKTNDKRDKNKESEVTDEKKEKKKEKNNFLKDYYNENGIKGTLELIIKVVKTALSKLKKLICRCKFRKFKIDIKVASEDAATTAIEYGGVCTVFYPFLEFLYSNLNFEIRQANVTADFDSANSDLELDTEIILRPIYVVFFGFSILKLLLQIKGGKL